MKKLIFALIFAVVLFGCSEKPEELKTTDAIEVPEIEIIKTDDPEVTAEPEEIEIVEESDETADTETVITEETPETVKPVGGNDDWTAEPTQKTFTVLQGKAEAGPCNLFSQVGAMSVDSDWIMQGYVPGWLQDNDGLFMIRGNFTGNFRFFDFYGTCYSEGMGRDVDGFRLKMVQSSSAEKHNINNATTLRFAVAQKHFTNPNDEFYNDIPGSFVAAKSEIYAFLGFPNATKNFYEMSVVGDTLADAYLFKFELAITKGRTGPEVGDYLGKMSNAIIENDLDFRADFITDVQELLIKEPWDNLKAELISRGIETDPAPLWLTHEKEYYTDLMARTPNVLESVNLDQTSQCNIDVSDRDSFAYPVEFSDIENARYIATQLSGNLSLWTVSTCDNGTAVFSCPGTQLLTVEKLREILLPNPANLSYNGLIEDNELITGHFYLVQNLDSPGSVSHSCAGEMAPFGRNLATVGNIWVDAIGYNNTTSWFRRGIKYVTTD